MLTCVKITAYCTIQSINKHTHTHRQQCFNVVLQEGDDILPVQYVSQPAVLPLQVLLVATVASAGCYILREKKKRSTELQYMTSSNLTPPGRQTYYQTHSFKSTPVSLTAFHHKTHFPHDTTVNSEH